jgi:hypothetical protein
MVIRICAEAAHASRLDNYASFEVAERGTAMLLHDIINKVWYNNLKDADTFYTKVTSPNIITLLDTNRGDLYALDMIALHTNMCQYYMQVDSIPQFIVMMKDALKKAKRAGMPIACVELIMMALVVVLAAQHLLCKVDDWESLPATRCT